MNYKSRVNWKKTEKWFEMDHYFLEDCIKHDIYIYRPLLSLFNYTEVFLVKSIIQKLINQFSDFNINEFWYITIVSFNWFILVWYACYICSNMIYNFLLVTKWLSSRNLGVDKQRKVAIFNLEEEPTTLKIQIFCSCV